MNMSTHALPSGGGGERCSCYMAQSNQTILIPYYNFFPSPAHHPQVSTTAGARSCGSLPPWAETGDTPMHGAAPPPRDRRQPQCTDSLGTELLRPSGTGSNTNAQAPALLLSTLAGELAAPAPPTRGPVTGWLPTQCRPQEPQGRRISPNNTPGSPSNSCQGG